ncbi:MAG: hypothetical protein A2015_13355 [Spirochaetes bacterium GWF1_31_7]|nr:MAG: hypothetical protein A2Y30_11470 [Spirochaetes bacterium GWE1_32_154]OHD49810.1 MAG: hypothetical protein A2015_13355 [Spirochaetes bacterium GWF1_31_7]OHD52772.1 MAG: hypothetical protein A2Y29_15595 [Spirochaetes bacterium GWE2_31_10]OHD82814.1 MAG: hypothetical protein A2355_17560 [Spirochaetes bacterium RIFOXYB1_FULL_32_8]
MITDNKIKTYLQVNFIKFFFYIFVIAIGLFSLYSLVPLLTGVITAFIISYLINPIVGYFERQQIQRIWVIISIFIAVFFIIAGLIFITIEFFPSQKSMAEIQSKTITNLSILKDDLKIKYPIINWDELNDGLIDKIKSSFNLTDTIPKIISNISGVFSLLIVIPFTVFFFLLNEREIRKWLLSFIPNKYFEMSLITLREVDNIFGSYIRGTLLESLVIGILTSLGWYVCGFQLGTAIITGSIAGLANAIPYVGPLFGAILGVSLYVLNLIPIDNVSIFGLSPSIIKILIVVAITQVLDQIIKPAILGKSVNLHPLIVILGIMAGSNLFGFVGMLAAIPVIAIIKVVISTLHKQLKEFGFLSETIFSVITQNVSESKGSHKG